jgi:uncharacterized membrane protein YhdT
MLNETANLGSFAPHAVLMAEVDSENPGRCSGKMRRTRNPLADSFIRVGDGEQAMSPARLNRRDYWAGALMMLIGLAGIIEGRNYGIGTFTQMGSGFFPVALGGVMTLLGVLIAGTAYLSSEPDHETFLPANPQWFAWACIISSPIVFIVLGEYMGLLPATLACVFIAALGDKETTCVEAAKLSAVVTVIGIALFSYLLKIPFPIIRGVW